MKIGGNNCFLINAVGVTPFRRCSYCERNLRNCFGFQFFFIVLGIIGLLVLMFFIADLPALIVDINILILLLLGLLGYIAGNETNEIVLSNFLLNELNAELAKRVDQKTKELQVLVFELQKSLKLKSDLTKGVGHDLKSALTAIMGYCDILQGKQSGELTETQMKFIISIRRNGDTLLSLINSLMNVAGLKDNDCPSGISDQNLGKSISEAVASAEPLALKKNVSINTRIGADASSFLVNHDCVKLIMTNLLSNAVNFSPQDSHVLINAVEEKDKISVSVEDNGPGLRPEEQKNIFDLHNSASASKEHPKIGLSIVKTLVESGGGTVHAKNKEGGGSIFTFTLPKTNI